MCIFLLLPPIRTSVCLFFFLAGSGPLHEIPVSAFSRSQLGRVNTFSFRFLLLIPRMSLNVLPLPLSFFTPAFPFFLPFLLPLSWYPPNLSMDSTPYVFLVSSYFLPYFLDYIIPPYSSSPFRYFLHHRGTTFPQRSRPLGRE